MSAWAVFISGRGSNLQAILDLAGEVDVRVVYSSKAQAPGLLRARRAGVATHVLEKKIDWVWLSADLKRRKIGAIFLAGFMRLIPAHFLEEWEGRVLNVHPSLLPTHPGLHALENSFAQGSEMGVTVHVVTPEMDAGPRLLQGATLTRGPRPEVMAEAQWRISRMEQRLVRQAVRTWK